MLMGGLLRGDHATENEGDRISHGFDLGSAISIAQAPMLRNARVGYFFRAASSTCSASAPKRSKFARNRAFRCSAAASYASGSFQSDRTSSSSEGTPGTA